MPRIPARENFTNSVLWNATESIKTEKVVFSVVVILLPNSALLFYIFIISAEDEHKPSFEFDYNMDLLIALEMSRLQMIEDMNNIKMAGAQVIDVSDNPNAETDSDRCAPFIFACLSSNFAF